MRYFSFKNAAEFQQRFGSFHSASGLRRRNEILLKQLRDPQFFKWAVKNAPELLGATSNEDLVRRVLEEVAKEGRNARHGRVIYLPYGESLYCIPNTFALADDRNGICEDGDVRCYRIVKPDGHIVKIKIGKLLEKIILENEIGGVLLESTRRWVCECVAHEWQAFAKSCVQEFTLHVSDDAGDFARIYTSAEQVGDFNSCMNDDYNWSFYVNAVDAEAAWLENADGLIVARCVIYTCVHMKDGSVWRLAERQYSSDMDENLKRMLVNKLVEADEIDGYKEVGASCTDCSSFRDKDGNDISSLTDGMWIPCYLSDNDRVSYQDTFKRFLRKEERAYADCDGNLATTNGTANFGVWSEYLDDYIEENEAVWSDWYGTYIPHEDAVYILDRGDYIMPEDAQLCFDGTWHIKDDTIKLITGEYAPEDSLYIVSTYRGYAPMEDCVAVSGYDEEFVLAGDILEFDDAKDAVLRRLHVPIEVDCDVYFADDPTVFIDREGNVKCG